MSNNYQKCWNKFRKIKLNGWLGAIQIMCVTLNHFSAPYPLHLTYRLLWYFLSNINFLQDFWALINKMKESVVLICISKIIIFLLPKILKSELEIACTHDTLSNPRPQIKLTIWPGGTYTRRKLRKKESINIFFAL